MTVATVLVTLTNIGFFVADNFIHSLNNLPKGEIISSTAQDSLSGPYAVSFYLVKAGGRLGTALRAEATEFSTGKTYTVYWETNAKSSPLYSWISDTQISINGHTVELTEDGMHFDSRLLNGVA